MATNFKANSKNLSIITHKNYKIPQPDQQQKRLPQKPSFVIFRCHLRTSSLHQGSHKHCRPRHRSATQSPTYQRSQPHLHLFRTKLQFFALSLLASEENRYPGKYTYTLKPEKKNTQKCIQLGALKKKKKSTCNARRMHRINDTKNTGRKRGGKKSVCPTIPFLVEDFSPLSFSQVLKFPTQTRPAVVVVVSCHELHSHQHTAKKKKCVHGERNSKLCYATKKKGPH